MASSGNGFAQVVAAFGMLAFRAWAVVLCVCFLLYGPPAHAFKLKTHVIIANRSVAGISGTGSAAKIDAAGIGRLSLHNAEVAEAITTYPDFYRAGTLGPDVYPDLVGGQLWVHVNKGNEDNERECPGSPGCTAGGVPFEDRTFAQWRSIDNGMWVLKRANEYLPSRANPDERRKRLQALAFAYGYLTHMMGDAFAHSYVNEWVRSVFSYFEGNPPPPRPLYGAATEEIQHMAVEGYIDAHMPPVNDADLAISTPVEFLNTLYSEPVAQSGGFTHPGAFGGVYFETLLEIRNALDRLSDSNRWAEGTWAEPVVDAALRINAAATTLASFGTQIGDPITDVEDYFRRRRHIVDLVLTKWVVLSGCVAQNILHGSNAAPGASVTRDACAVASDGSTVDFEDSAELRDIFHGNVNKAAHHGQGESEFDYGRLAANVKKQELFLRAVLERGLLFSPSEDVRSLRKLKEVVQRCEGGLVNWRSCDEACTAARQVCTRVVEKSICLTCPKDSGRYSCSGWRASLCVAQPHCFGCVSDWYDIVIDPICTATVNSAAPVCEFCSQNTICAHVQSLRAVHDDFETFLNGVVRDALRKMVDAAKEKALAVYAGPYLNDFIELNKHLERRRTEAKPAWFVNIAFLKEDMLHDPNYLNLVLQQMLGIGGQLVDNSLALADAVQDTYDQTASAGQALMQTYVDVQTGATYAQLWRGLVDVLYRIAREQSFNAIQDLERSTYSWLDQFTFKTDRSQYDTRFAKFIALVAATDGLMSIRGPTAKLLTESMRLRANGRDDGSGTIDVEKFHPVTNAIRLTTLGFLGRDGIHELGMRAGVNTHGTQTFGFDDAHFVRGAGTPHQVSVICREFPHIACDAIQSLDDPNNFDFYSNSIAEGSRLGEATRVDVERSVSLWASRPTARTPGECELGLTNFLLAANEEIVTKLYRRMFLLPEYCDTLEAPGPGNGSPPTSPPRSGNEACGCASNAGADAGALAVLALLLIVRRKHASRTSHK